MKIGDRVVYINERDFPKFGKTGTVVISSSEFGRRMFGVVFDEYIGGHSLGGICQVGYGWECFDCNLELVEDYNMVEYTQDEIMGIWE